MGRSAERWSGHFVVSDAFSSPSSEYRTSWRLYLRGVWRNGLAVACVIGIAVALSPRSANDDLGPLGEGFIYGLFVLVPWYVYSLVVGGLVMLILRLTSRYPLWCRAIGVFFVSIGCALVIPILMYFFVSKTLVANMLLLMWLWVPLVSAVSWVLTVLRNTGVHPETGPSAV